MVISNVISNTIRVDENGNLKLTLRDGYWYSSTNHREGCIKESDVVGNLSVKQIVDLPTGRNIWVELPVSLLNNLEKEDSVLREEGFVFPAPDRRDGKVIIKAYKA